MTEENDPTASNSRSGSLSLRGAAGKTADGEKALELIRSLAMVLARQAAREDHAAEQEAMSAAANSSQRSKD